MIQYELTVKAYDVIFRCIMFFLTWIILMIQIDYVENKLSRMIFTLLPIPMMILVVIAVKATPDRYFKPLEDPGRQEVESRQDEDSAVFDQRKDGDILYKKIYINADGTLQVYVENP